MVASAAAPSVVTAYHRPPDFRDALFVVVSQSGRSPDVIDATQMARKFGALTLAIVNDENSPAATASELVLPIGAGTERSVAATKTVVLSMIAGAQLVAALAQDDDLSDGLRNLPQRLSGALACDWSPWAERAAAAAAAFVVGRGYGLGCVREIALKVSEILRSRSGSGGRTPRTGRSAPSRGSSGTARSRRAPTSARSTSGSARDDRARPSHHSDRFSAAAIPSGPGGPVLLAVVVEARRGTSGPGARPSPSGAGSAPGA